VDVICHLAANLGVEAVLDNPGLQYDNVLGIQNVLQVANLRRAKVLFTSTSSVYGDQTPPFHEDMPLLLKPDTMSSYACAKLMGEYQCKAFTQNGNVPSCVVRLFNMSGPRAATSGPYSFVLQRFVKAALRDEDIVVYGDGQQTRSFTYVKDCARILERLLLCPEAFDGRPINIGSSEETCILHLAHQVRRITGSSSQIVFKPYREVHPNFTDYQRRQPDCGRLANLISYRPTTGLEAIVRLTAESLERQKERAL
jgi:UDP-glucose 4-epimerase